MSQLIGPLQGMAHMLIKGGRPAISSTPWLDAGPSMALFFLQGRPDTPTMTALMHSIFADDGDDDALVAPLAIEDAEGDMALPEALAEQAEVAAEAAEVALAAASDTLLMETPGGQGHPVSSEIVPHRGGRVGTASASNPDPEGRCKLPRVAAEAHQKPFWQTHTVAASCYHKDTHLCCVHQQAVSTKGS